MKKLLAMLSGVLLLTFAGCGQTPANLANYRCDICWVDRRNLEQVSGSPTRSMFFDIFAPDANEHLRIFVESCWVGSIAPDYRLHFTVRYDVAELYAVLAVAESNVPFGVILDGETILLTTDIPGLKEVNVILAEHQEAVGFSYGIIRSIE